MKRNIIFLVFCSLILSVYATRPAVVAHRGYHRADGSAENSIRALVKADSINAEYCEFDVWISADDELFVNHNADINGVVIETSKAKAIAPNRLKNGEPIPTLDAFLDTAATLNIGLVLEVKPHKDQTRENVAVPKIIEMVKSKGLNDRTTYITFSANACRLLAEQSGRPVYYLTGSSPETVAELGATGPDFHISHFRKNPDWIKTFHAMGMPVNIWTVDKPEDILYGIAEGVDFITTNEPELTQKLISDNYDTREFTIMSYNLRFGELATMDELAAEIKAQRPDFVALQEVDVNSLRTMAPHNNGINFVNELAQRTGMFGYFGKALNFSNGGYYGVAILSRYPAEKIETIKLPNPKNVEPRVMLKGTFLLENDMPICFVSTHFDFTSPETQLLQDEYIIKNVINDNLPTIVAGDFNSTPDSETIKTLEQHFVRLSGDRPTFPAKSPEKRLDYIFGYPKDSFKLIETTEATTGKSDHLWVGSIIELKR